MDMRLTDFWSRMEARFGATYARSVAADYRLPALGATIDEAIAAGVEAKLGTAPKGRVQSSARAFGATASRPAGSSRERSSPGGCGRAWSPSALPSGGDGDPPPADPDGVSCGYLERVFA